MLNKWLDRLIRGGISDKKKIRWYHYFLFPKAHFCHKAGYRLILEDAQNCYCEKWNEE